MMEFTIEMAKEAGKALMEKFGNLEKVEYKGVYDLLTEADLAANDIITKRIKEKFPDHNLISEESEHEKTDSEYTWHVDPLDGTLNFAAGIPIFTTSIGLARNGEVILGVVYNPATDEMFTAEKGKGAFLNGKKIEVSAESNLRNVLASTPVNRSEDSERIKNELAIIEKLVPKVRGIRMYNSCAYDMCSVAMGQFGFYLAQFVGSSWDFAAGKIILEEAKGRITDMGGNKINLDSRQILCSNRVLHDEILELIK